MKEKTKIIISVIITFIITISITVTASLITNSSNITFKSDKTDKTNVKDSLDELYNYSINKYNEGFEDGLRRSDTYKAVETESEIACSYNATDNPTYSCTGSLGCKCNYNGESFCISCSEGCSEYAYRYAEKKSATITHSYSCPNGGTLSGDTCLKTCTIVSYSCIDGYTLNGTICVKK